MTHEFDFDTVTPANNSKSEDYGFERSLPGLWADRLPAKGDCISALHCSVVARIDIAMRMLSDALDTDPDIRSGVPVLKGTRFPVSQLLAEVSDEQNIAEIADNWDLDLDLVRQVFRSLSICLDRPYISR